MSEFDRNQEVADRICHELCWKGQQFKLGDYVALLDAEVVAVADSPQKALQAVRSIDPEPTRGMIVEVAEPVPDVIR